MRLKVDARARAILRRLPVVNVYSVAELALLALLAVQSARLLWTVVTPIAPLGDWRPAQPSLPGSPADILSGFDPFFRVSGAQAATAQVTSLQLTLFGIRVDEAMGRGSAILAGPDGVQNSVSVGQEVASGVTLKAVYFDHITLDRGGASEDLFLDQSGGAAATPATAAPGQPAAMPGASPPPVGAVTTAQIQADIGFIPRIEGGRVAGMVVRSQGSGAAFRAAGLQDGDIVTALGGRSATGAGDLERVAQDYAKGGSVPMTVERGGQTLSLSLPVAPR